MYHRDGKTRLRISDLQWERQRKAIERLYERKTELEETRLRNSHLLPSDGSFIHPTTHYLHLLSEGLTMIDISIETSRPTPLKRSAPKDWPMTQPHIAKSLKYTISEDRTDSDKVRRNVELRAMVKPKRGGRVLRTVGLLARGVLPSMSLEQDALYGLREHLRIRGDQVPSGGKGPGPGPAQMLPKPETRGPLSFGNPSPFERSRLNGILNRFCLVEMVETLISYYSDKKM